MDKIIGIRREDKNEWERRVPLVPDDVRWLRERHGIRTIVQPSPIRVFRDDEYRAAGAEVSEDLGGAGTVFAVKEIPAAMFRPDRTYVFFSHTIKGQPYNMDMLRTMVERHCSLIDYERVIDEKSRRLIFFGRFAGLAGMLDTLHGYGLKLQARGIASPFAAIQQAYRYATLEEAKAAVEAVGAQIDDKGFPEELCPLVVGFAGYGNVSRGAQEIFDLLPHKVLSAEALLEMIDNFSSDTLNLVKVVFGEDDMVRPLQGAFDLQEYYAHPERYESKFENYLPQLSILVNCIYWTERYPRLVTKDYLRQRTVLESTPRLQVIGDISCDIDGSIEITHKATKPDHAFFTHFAGEDRFVDGVEALGTTVMAVDNLPCEFPRESSLEFSRVLRDFVPAIAGADYGRQTDALELPFPVRKALLLHRGRFTADYDYMREFVKTGGAHE